MQASRGDPGVCTPVAGRLGSLPLLVLHGRPTCGSECGVTRVQTLKGAALTAGPAKVGGIHVLLAGSYRWGLGQGSAGYPPHRCSSVQVGCW